ncbi:MAG: histidine kinase [Ginsengibacter sp.]
MANTVLSKKRFSIFFFTWWIIWGVMQYLVLTEIRVMPGIALIESVTSTIILTGITFIVTNNMKYYLPENDRWWYILAISAMGSFLWLVLLQMVLKFLPPTETDLLLFRETWTIRYVTGLLLIGTISTFTLLWYSQQAEKETAIRRTEMEKLAKDAELVKLRQQLQPHFLFNSLNSIGALVKSNPDKARQMLHQLSDFLRGTMRKDDHQFTSIKDELEQLNLYLEIEKVRFGYRLQTNIDCPPELFTIKIPAFILQPIVENAIKFGLYDTLDDVLIDVDFKINDQLLRIQIKNPYDETTFESLKGTGFGLSSIKKQLYLLYGRTNLLKTERLNNIFISTIYIPIGHEHESNNN